MICLHELKNLRVYSKNIKFLIPSNKKDPKHGSAIFLVSPNIETSKEMMNLPYCVNKRQFESYYTEKAVNKIITTENFNTNTNQEYIEESKLSSKERNKLSDSQFGIPSLRKYPLNDVAHVRDAIKKFNHVDEKYEAELARNILAAIDRFKIKDINVGDDNRFRKYMKPVEELSEASMVDIFAGNMTPEYKVNKFGIINNEQCIYIANDLVNESDSKYDMKIKRMIYNDRMKNNKVVLDIYSDIKDSTSIKYTYLTLDLYKRRNLFIDTSFYNELFIKNNTFKLDKGVDLYIDFLERLTDMTRLPDYNIKTIFIPVEAWRKDTEDTLLDYKYSINPISAIYRLLKTHKHIKLTNMWADYTVVFVGKSGYFKMDMANIEKQNVVRFANNITRLLSKAPIEDEEEINKDSKDAIVATIYNNIQNNTGITFKKNLVGDVDDIKDTSDSEDNVPDDEDELDKAIDKAASKTNSVEDAVEYLDDEYTASLINDIAASSGGDMVDISPARAARINTLNQQFDSKKVNGIPVKDLLKDADDSKIDEKLEETAIPINSINDSWKHMTFMNFEKAYNLDADIVSILRFFGTRRYPVSVVDMKVEDTSTSEDLVNTWTVKMEDSVGSRFTLVFDIPKFIPNSRFMRLRGNDKTINAQLMNIPVVKTDLDTCQITSNYNKIFISPYGSSAGKSFVTTDRVMKTLNKLTSKSKITVEIGDNSKLAEKYDLPIDYVDFSANYSKIRFPGGMFIFNQDELYKKYPEKMSKLKPGNIAIGVYNTGELILYYSGGTVSNVIMSTLCERDKEFAEVYPTTNPGVRYKYSKASILNTKIPLIVVMAYSEGLTSVLKKASVQFTISDKKLARVENKDEMDIIKFNDSCIIYQLNYSSSLLMNGLKECNTEDYSIKDIDSHSMWTDFLDIFGGRIKADGLDNFYDLMVDPITLRVCPVYNLPTDYVEQLVYANNLLADSKYNRHTDLSGNRYRTNELIAAHTYKCLAKSYSDYRIKLKKTGKASMTIKQSAIIDSILSDNTTSDLSANNDLSYVETAATVSFKGISGMNSERSYGIDKRTYDNSMKNKLAMSTGFAGTSGVNRQTTINMNIDSSRGYIKADDKANNDMNVTNTLCISEAIMPMCSTKDDPFRLAMSFIQNSKHSIASEANDPCLVTTGADDAIAYLAPDIFNYKAKANGKVIKKTDKYMIVEYKDKSTEYIELNPKTYKNSDGGFYLSVKLDTDLKEGSTFKAGSILAYNRKMYTKDIGYDDNPTMNRGVLCKVAMLVTDEGFEDSGLNSDYCEKALSRKVTVCVDVALNKKSNVYNVLKVGDHVEEGENLLVFQNAFDDEDANALMKTLVNDKETINELGRIPKKSKVTGDIVDIHISRTCDLDGMSSTLKKLVTDYEKDIEATKKIMQKYDPEKAKTLRSNYKLENTGKLKNLEDGVLIEFYIEFITDFSSGDKLCINGGNKAVSRGSIPAGQEPYSSYRPQEKIDLLTSINSNNGRMILSNVYIGLISKGLIELDRQVKEIMGIAKPEIYDIHEYLHPEITKLQKKK